MKKAERFERLLSIFDTAIEAYNTAPNLDPIQRRGGNAWFENYKRIVNEEKELGKVGRLKLIESQALTEFNESYSAISLHFWKLIKEKGIDLERKDVLQIVLDRGRIRSMDEYEIITDSIVDLQQSGYSEETISTLSTMLGDFETRRF